MENKIYAKEHEKFVKAQMLYVRSIEETDEDRDLLYVDEECTIPATRDVVVDLYCKNMLTVCIKPVGGYVTPIFLNTWGDDDNKYASLLILTGAEETTSLYSVEYLSLD